MKRNDNKVLALKYIKEQIITCAMLPGSTIQVNEIAKQLQVSITPIREALLELEYEGYVTLIPRKRTIVRKISLQDLKDIYDARSFIEPQILSGLQLSDIELHMSSLLSLKEQWEKIDICDQTRENYVKFLNKDIEFHEVLASMSRNPYLLHFCTELIYKSQRFWYMALFNNRLDVVRTEHLKIVESLIKGDITAAVAHCEKHISVSKALSILTD